MKITEELVDYVSQLSRLQLPQEEKTAMAAQLEGMNLPEVDPLAQMVEGARQYGADLSNPMISSDGQGNYSAMGVNQQVKTVLQTIVDAADRGENLLRPCDAQFRDVAGVVAVWDKIFATVPFDITREETPSVEPLFDWWVDRAEGDSPYTSSLPPVAFPPGPGGADRLHRESGAPVRPAGQPDPAGEQLVYPHRLHR